MYFYIANLHIIIHSAKYFYFRSGKAFSTDCQIIAIFNKSLVFSKESLLILNRYFFRIHKLQKKTRPKSRVFNYPNDMYS